MAIWPKWAYNNIIVLTFIGGIMHFVCSFKPTSLSSSFLFFAFDVCVCALHLHCFTWSFIFRMKMHLLYFHKVAKINHRIKCHTMIEILSSQINRARLISLVACTNWLLAHQRHIFHSSINPHISISILHFKLNALEHRCIAGQHEYKFLHKSIVLIVDTTTRSEKKPFAMAIALRWNEAKSKETKMEIGFECKARQREWTRNKIQRFFLL